MIFGIHLRSIVMEEKCLAFLWRRRRDKAVRVNCNRFPRQFSLFLLFLHRPWTA